MINSDAGHEVGTIDFEEHDEFVGMTVGTQDEEKRPRKVGFTLMKSSDADAF